MSGDKLFKRTGYRIFGDDNAGSLRVRNTEVVSQMLNLYEYRRAGLCIQLLSNSTPTDVQLLMHISPNQGTTWFPVLTGFMSTLVWDDTICSTVYREAYDIALPAAMTRFSIIGRGCNAQRYFDVDVWLLPYSE